MSDAKRSVAVRPHPGFGESLDSWIARWATMLHTTRTRLLTHIGVQHRATLAVGMPIDDRHRIHIATGLTDAEIIAMTLESYERQGINTREILRTPRGQEASARARTRICPHCIAETGQWKLDWRLAITFACLEHRVLLVDTCPGRQHHIETLSRHPGVVRQNWQCPSYIDDEGTTCGHDLREASGEQLPEEHPVLRAQSQIAAHLNNGMRPEQLLNFIRDMRAIAAGVSAEHDLARIEAVSALPVSQITGFLDDGGFATLMPNMESVIEAALNTYAIRVLDDLRLHGESNLLVPVVEYSRQFCNRATPTDIQAQWGKLSPAINTYISALLRTNAIDTYRLRYYTPLPPKARTTPSIGLIRSRARSVPQLLWPALTNLISDAKTDLHLRWACAQALLIPGSPEDSDRLREELWMAPPITPDASYLMRYDDTERKRLYAILCECADYLDTHPTPIDYERRRRLNYRGLLDERAWQPSPLRWMFPRKRPIRANLQYVLWMRLTGSHPLAAPPWLRQDADQPSRVAALTFDDRLQDALDEHAAAFLAGNGIIDEPVHWDPTGEPELMNILIAARQG